MASSFISKLRMNSLYPTLPFKKEREDENYDSQIRQLSDRGIQKDSPINRIGHELLSKPMDVKYNAPESDKVGLRILGYDDSNRISPYQRATLADKDADRDLKASQMGINAQATNRRLSVQERQVLINEIKNSKILPEAEKIKLMADVESGHITQRGQIESGHISERGNEAKGIETQRQGGRESLAEIQSRHAKELESQKSLNKPTGSTSTSTVTDAEGKPVGTRTTETKDTLPSKPVDSSKVIRQRSPSTGKIRESTDGGKTWRIVN